MSDLLKLMENQIVQQIQRYHQLMGTRLWDYRVASRDLACQVGSLNKLIMQLDGERFSYQKKPDEIKKEIADILSMVLFIAHQLNININEVWVAMLHSDEKKFNMIPHNP